VATLDIDVRVAYPGFSLHTAHAIPLEGITAVFGASGSGKSTLLRVIAGLERGARGHVRFGDEVWLDSERGTFVPPHERGVGFVFQDARLLPFLSVAGNLHYAERRARGGGERVAFDEVVAAFGLASLLGRACTALSGGERQRVTIARALLTRPRLLCMDEPLSANDVVRKADLLPYVRELPARFGVPVVYVSHAIDEVAYLADHMLVIGAGRKVAAGRVGDVLQTLDLGRDGGRFEAGVLLSGTILRHDAVYSLTHVTVDGARLLLPRLDLPPGATVRLRVRARDVALATRRPEGISIRNVLEGELVELDEDPATAYAEGVVAVGSIRIRARVTRAAIAELGLRVGDPVFALIKSVTIDDQRAVD
jgi:molybdate transport system ATP-binding protein